MRTFVFIIELVVVAAIAIWLLGQPGSVAIDWGAYHLDTQLSVAFLVLIALFLVLYFILRIWRFIILLPTRMLERAQRMRPGKGLKALTQASISTALDEYDHARNEAHRFERYLGPNPVYHGIIAYNYLKQGKYEEALSTCETMKKNDDGNTLAWALQARIAIMRRQDAVVVEQLNKLFKIHGTSPWVVRNLVKYALKSGMFETAQTALERAERLKLFPTHVISQCYGLMHYEKSKQNALSLEEKETLLERAHRYAPDIPNIAVQYAKVLRLKDKDRRARKILEHSWAQRPDPEIMAEYLELEGSTDPKELLAEVDRLMTYNSSDQQSYLSMADYALKHQLWGRARAALQDAQKDYGLNQKNCHMMAQLELMEHGDQARYREWMERALSNPRLEVFEINFDTILK